MEVKFVAPNMALFETPLFKSIVAVALLVVGIVLFIYAFKKMRESLLIADTPTSKIRSVALGLVAINGSVVAEKVIKTPFSRIECVFYKYEIQEFMNSEARKNIGGMTISTSRTSFKWETIEKGQDSVPFSVRDDTGVIRVDPNGAKFEAQLKKGFYQRSVGSLNLSSLPQAIKNYQSVLKGEVDLQTGKKYDKLKSFDITKKSFLRKVLSFSSYRSGDRRFLEYIISPDDKLYVIGTAAENSNNGLIIKKGENDGTFLISNIIEKRISKNLKWKILWYFLLGVLSIVLSAIVFWSILT